MELIFNICTVNTQGTLRFLLKFIMWGMRSEETVLYIGQIQSPCLGDKVDAGIVLGRLRHRAAYGKCVGVDYEVNKR